MRPITRKAIRQFVENRSGARDQARRIFRVWMKTLEHAEWANFADLRETFPSADLVGICVVFDVGHNKYRVIANVDYSRQAVYFRAVYTHQEYDAVDWQKDCHCHSKPGKKKPAKSLERPA